MTDAYEIVEANWPFDGPHSDETIATAATALDRLTRYMANATWRRPETGASLYRILSGLHAASSHLDQVLRQLAECAEGRVADASSLFDDRHDRPGADTAAEVAILLRGANAPLKRVAKSLADAASAASHLGNDEAVRRG